MASSLSLLRTHHPHLSHYHFLARLLYSLPPLYPFRSCHSQPDPIPSLQLVDPPHPKKPTSFTRIAQRIQLAFDRIVQRRLPPGVGGLSNGVRSEIDIINVVEHRISCSMLEGHFENLSGKGKPLQIQSNPHADPTEDLFYKILARNGCAPEWVVLNKEIRFCMERWRSQLRSAWKRRMELVDTGKSDVELSWEADLTRLKGELRDINQKVLHYNLIVPFGRQVFFFKLEEELQKVK